MSDGPAFDHRVDGTPARAWATRRAALPGGSQVGPHDHLLVCAAHPDDESLGAGGLLAQAAHAGAQITVVIATDGEASHPDSRSHRPADLARLRRAEVTRAIGVLAPSASLVLLHRPDGTLAADPDGLVADLSGCAADVTVIAAPWRADGHPDHAACGGAAAAVARASGARLLEYPVWGWHWGVPGRSGPLAVADDGGRWVRVELDSGTRAAKRAALAEHRSQHAALSPAAGDEAILGPGLLEQFAGPDEVFLQSAPADLPSRYFDRLYARDADPWGIARGFYERRKRDLLLAALPRPSFGRAFEPGCAQGLLTVELARRCGHVLACDASERAVVAAAERTAQYGHVEVQVGRVPEDWPAGVFDLVVVSELGYYLADPVPLAQRARAALSDDGVLVACHWRHPAPGYPSTTREVHDALGAGLFHAVSHVEPDLLLDVWCVREASVAQLDGVR